MNDKAGATVGSTCYGHALFVTAAAAATTDPVAHAKRVECNPGARCAVAHWGFAHVRQTAVASVSCVGSNSSPYKFPKNATAEPMSDPMPVTMLRARRFVLASYAVACLAGCWQASWPTD